MSELQTVLSTGVGSWPGTDMADALKIAFAECPELPYLPELPARGAHAQLIGRSAAFLSGLAVDLQPAGWRLTDASSREHRLAKATMRSDLDLLEEIAQGYAGLFKISVAGPWTLAAMMERPRGDRVVADHGARRDLSQSLTEGIGELVADVRRRLPDLRIVLQLDEPLLPSVLAGSVPTASGFSRHRYVDIPEASSAITAIVERLAATGEVPMAVHCCAADAPVELVWKAGVRGVSLDLDLVTTQQWDAIGAAMSEGLWLGLGALPTNRSTNPDEVAQRTLRPLRALRMDPAYASQLVLTPSCGLASFNPEAAVRALRTLRTAAGIVTEQLAD
ncbi:MAG TPA: methionine synthase [Propionibacteriaceae bacterium]